MNEVAHATVRDSRGFLSHLTIRLPSEPVGPFCCRLKSTYATHAKMPSRNARVFGRLIIFFSLFAMKITRSVVFGRLNVPRDHGAWIEN